MKGLFVLEGPAPTFGIVTVQEELHFLDFAVRPDYQLTFVDEIDLRGVTGFGCIPDKRQLVPGSSSKHSGHGSTET